MSRSLSRRHLLAGLGTLPVLAAPMLAQSAPFDPVPAEVRPNAGVSRNTSSFRARNWREHFDTLGKGVVLCDLSSRALHYWGPDDITYRVFPTSVPLNEDLTRRGYTEVVRKKVGPTWTPTPSMRERNPDLPDNVGPGPANPLGTHAMYLDWPAYLIHGTHDNSKIGRPSSSGCIGLYNEQVVLLYDLVGVGTQVRVM